MKVEDELKLQALKNLVDSHMNIISVLEREMREIQNKAEKEDRPQENIILG